MSVHIDDLRSSQDIVSDVHNLRNVSICDLFKETTKQSEGMCTQTLTLESQIDIAFLFYF